MSIASPGGIALDADGLETRGGILLRGANVRGGINLSAVRLSRDVNAVGARIERPGEVALNGDGIVAGGDLALRGATIVGEVRVLGARFGGDVDCTSASLSQPDGYALRLNRTTIDGAFFLRQNASVIGTLDLTATTMGAIDDEQASWPQSGDLLLNRCQYGAFIGGPVDAESRLDWLSRQTPARWKADFWPQPYEHLSTVLREMGHDEDARAVLIAKERLQRRARRARAKNPVLRVALAAMDGILAITLRYGRQPLLALVWLMLFWAMGTVVFAVAYRTGAMKPNSPVVLRSAEWTMCDLAADRKPIHAVERTGPDRTRRRRREPTFLLPQSAGSSQLSGVQRADVFAGRSPAGGIDRTKGILATGLDQAQRNIHLEILFPPVGHRLGLEPAGGRRILRTGQIEIARGLSVARTLRSARSAAR